MADTIGARLDRLQSAWPVWRLIVLISLGGFFEFYDLMMTAYISPGLVRAGVFHDGARGLFGLADQATFASATFLGLFLGVLIFAGVADRFGRRAIFTGSLIWYACATAIMALQSSAVGIDAWRLIAGIGIGVELVTIDAYISELAPARMRGRAFAVNQAIQFLAVPTVALACWLLVPRAPLGIAGWRWVMLGGAAGAVVVWLIRAGIPESPRWLAARGRSDEANRIVAKLEAASGLPVTRPVAGAVVRERRGRLREIFQPPYARRTALLALFNALQAIGFYGFGNWAPSLIAAQGHGVVKSLQYALIIAVAYPAAPFLCAAFADRFERKHLIGAAAAGTALFGLLFAMARAPVVLIGLGVAITFSNNLMSFAYHAYQAELFPTRIRAWGVGFVYSWSRISTVFSSFIIAALLGAFGPRGVFTFIALAMVAAIVVVGALGPQTGGRTLEEVSA
ncbi:MAG TPA: MFS transporter [Caulobacteraceae bacterium]